MFGSDLKPRTSVQQEADRNWRILLGNTVGCSTPELVSRSDLASKLRFLRRNGQPDVARELLACKGSCSGK